MNEEKNYGIRILIFGILSIPTIIGLIFAILVIVYFIKDSKKNIMAIIGLFFAAFFLIVHIISVAMIFLIAGGVFFQTPSSLQSKSLDVGKATQEKNYIRIRNFTNCSI